MRRIARRARRALAPLTRTYPRAYPVTYPSAAAGFGRAPFGTAPFGH